MLKAIDTSRVSESVLRLISDLIRTGGYAPGDRLPSERKMAAQLGVSRTTIREALRKLETVGLLVIRQGLGTFVKDPSSEVLQSTLVPYVVTDADTTLKLFELREIIEIEAAARAAGRAHANQLEQMQRWIEVMETKNARGDLEGSVVADVEFHREVIAATGNNILVELMDSLVDLLREMRRASPDYPDLLPQSVADHRAVLRALQAGDSAAARAAMQMHLDRVRDTLDLGPR